MPFPVKVKIRVRVKDNIKIKGNGWEFPSDTFKNPGLKPAWIVDLYAALKRRSSTVLHAFVLIFRDLAELSWLYCRHHLNLAYPVRRGFRRAGGGAVVRGGVPQRLKPG